MGKISFGLFSTAWMIGVISHVGMGPEGMIIKSLLQMIGLMAPDFLGISIIILLILGLLRQIEIILTIFQAGGLAIVAFICGYLSGLYIVSKTGLGIIRMFFELGAATVSTIYF